jgi:ABC-type uncharacterized transport system ATPase subunit
MTSVLQLEGITKTFGGVTALDDVSISADAGRIVAIVGDNGASTAGRSRSRVPARPAATGSRSSTRTSRSRTTRRCS